MVERTYTNANGVVPEDKTALVLTEVALCQLYEQAACSVRQRDNLFAQASVAIALKAALVQSKQRCRELEADLLTATSIGMSLIITRVGPRESLTGYMRRQYDNLSALYAKCDGAFNAAIASGEKGGSDAK